MAKERNSYVMRGCNLDPLLADQLLLHQMNPECMQPLEQAMWFMESANALSELYRDFDFPKEDFCGLYAKGLVYQKKGKIAFENKLPGLFLNFNNLATETFDQIGCQIKYAQQIMAKGEFFQYQGQNAEAIQLFDQSLLIFQQENASALLIATIHFMRGNSLVELGEVEEGIEEIRKCVLLAGENHGLRNFALNRLGNLWYALGCIGKSEKYYSLIIRIAKSTNDNEARLKAEANLSGIWFLRGKLDQSERTFVEFVSEYSALDIPLDRKMHNIGFSFFQLSKIHGQRDDLETAVHFVRMAIHAWSKIKVTSIKIDPLMKGYIRLVTLLLEQENIEVAKDAFNKFVTLGQKMPEFQNFGLYKLFMRILFLRVSKRLGPRLSAEKLCKQLLDNPELPFDLRLQILWVLVDTLLEEFQLTQEAEILTELNSRVNEMKELTSANRLRIDELNLELFEAKLQLFQTDTRKFLTTIEKLKRKAEELKLEGLLQRILKEEVDVKEKLMKAFTVVEQEKEQVEAIREEGMADFISSINSKLRNYVKNERLKK